MGKSLTDSNQIFRFCRAFLRTLDPQSAAEIAGLPNGFHALTLRNVQNLLEKMRLAVADQIQRDDAVRHLAQIAFGPVNDVVALAAAWRSGNPIDPQSLNLSAVSELKLLEKGVEVKFIDRVRALDALCSLLGDGQNAIDFFQALEDVREESS